MGLSKGFAGLWNRISLNLNDKVDSSFSSLYLNINDNYKYPSNFGVDILAHPLIRKFYPTIRIKGDDYPSLEKDQVFWDCLKQR